MGNRERETGTETPTLTSGSRCSSSGESAPLPVVPPGPPRSALVHPPAAVGERLYYRPKLGNKEGCAAVVTF